MEKSAHRIIKEVVIIKKRVFLNAGHGEKNDGVYDSGAVGATGYKEAIETREVTELVSKMLQFNGIETLVVQDGDLQDVVSKSNKFLADLFVSIHANSFANNTAHGIETFSVASVGLGFQLAKAIHKYLVPASGLFDRGLKTANYYVIKYTNAPACLTEIGFISNPAEEALMKDPIWDEKVATAIAKGICEVLGIVYKESVKEGVVDVLDVAILKASAEDEWSAKEIDAKLGGVACFTRQGATRLIPKDAMSARQLYVIGGSSVGHPNEILLSGNTKFDTAVAVGNWLAKH